MEKYSVLMSLYKKEHPEHLRIALDSMLNQTVKPDEIVLVEDGPLTSELYKVVEDFKPYLTIVKNENNLGLGLALNKGLKACKNELVARMDTDDIAVSNRCEKQLMVMEKDKSLCVLGGQIEEFIDNKVIDKRVVPCTNEEIYSFLRRRCPFNHMTVMFRKRDVLEVGNYRDFFLNEDYDLWVRLAKANKKFANLPDVLVSVRVGKEMYSRRGGMKYYESEKKLQKKMLSNGIISFPRYCINVFVRFVFQVIIPNWLRGKVFRIFARVH